MWKKVSKGLKILTIYNIFSALYILFEYSRAGGVTYFLTSPVWTPFSLVVLGFDLFLVLGTVLAVWTRKLWWWKVGVANYGYAMVIALIVIAKLFFGSKSVVMGASEFWLNLVIYSLQLIFFGLIMQYWLLAKPFFRVRK